MRIVVYFGAIVSLLFGIHSASARIVTLVVTSSKTTDTLQVASNEVVRIVSYVNSSGGTSRLTVNKNGADIWGGSPASGDAQDLAPRVFAGACTLTLNYVTSLSQAHYCTVEITPDGFSPDKTLIVPQGTTAIVNLECSTNLVHWTNIWTGTYSNVPANKFFRLTAQRP